MPSKYISYKLLFNFVTSSHNFFVQLNALLVSYQIIFVIIPSTANIKPVEVWLLFNLAYPVLVIMVNVLLLCLEFPLSKMNYRLEKKPQEKNRNNK